MKKAGATQSLAAKTAAYVFLALSVLVLALSVVCIYLEANYDFYAREPEQIKTDILQSMYGSESFNVFSRLRSGQEPQSGTEGLRFEVYEEDGSLLWKSPQAPAGNELSFKVKYTSFFMSGPVDGSYEGSDPSGWYLICYADAQLYNVRTMSEIVQTGWELRFWLIGFAVISLILSICLLVFLVCAAGHRAGREGIVPGVLTPVPLDITTAAAILLVILAFALVNECAESNAQMILAVFAVMWFAEIGAVWLCDLAIRIKLGKWWKNTVIYRLLAFLLRLWRGLVKWLGSVFSSLPLIWRSMAAVLGVCFLEFLAICICSDLGSYFGFWIFEHTLLVAAAAYLALALRRLKAGGAALAAGKMDSTIDEKYLVWDLKEHAQDLNSISLGMSRAVEARLKSERFKTELITNVSHDIKTPLTSIINYSDLICREECGNEKINEYAQVLHRQSERLKKLIEDLMEASKASTGNLEVNLTPCRVDVLLEQAAGEYEQRMQECGLELVVKQPQDDIEILADSRHIWRIFDNLMNNVCKYALPGTRVYLSAEAQDGKAVFSIKNISRYPLDIPAETLMERFIRGDSSRSTEGSGLGLSIAQSLTELQKGSLELTVDGDFFKVCLIFDILSTFNRRTGA